MKQWQKVALLIWAGLVLPGMVSGALWSGSAPLWPPVVSGSSIDLLVWAALFLLGYGVPVAIFLMIALARRGTG